MKINNRLKNVANFVLKDSNVIDVGCDHALLCIYLASNYPNMRLIASDVREGPLKQAKANIEKYGLEDRITLKLGDGIATIDNDTNVIVISGMGGITIANIITKNKKKLDKIDQIVVSPNNDFYAVRSEITKLGFIIDREEVKAEKIILGVPLYTRLWKEENDKVTSKVVNMNNINKTIPQEASRIWNDDLKQYYVEYIKDNATYKMWIEDETSIKNKISLIKTYNLAGCAAWEKDRETENIWQIIAEGLK